VQIVFGFIATNGLYLGLTFRAKGNISYPQRITDKTVVLYTLIFATSDRSWGDRSSPDCIPERYTSVA
jgi:hypothetical protein